jgi:aldose 1-epimerase
MNINSEYYGRTKDQQTVELFTLNNDNGIIVRITNYGGIIQSLIVPDRNGKYEDIVLGYDNLESYLEDTPYFGAIVGRYANRIANAKFILDGVEYILAKNVGNNHLHGGIVGFDKVVWKAKTILNRNNVVLELNYLSKDGEEGYPGNLDVTVKYILTNDNELIIDYKAITDKATHLNLTNHSYFNLSANFNKDILNHELWLNSNTFIPTDSEAIPLGKIESVIGTPFDFTKSKKIGDRINEKNQQLINGRGYDHCMIFKDYDKTLKLQATLYEEKSGRQLEMFTTEPAVQIYTGNYLDGSFIGKGNIAYNHRVGVCLETEHFPDTPNRKEFPTTILHPGENYSSKTVYKFKTK